MESMIGRSFDVIYDTLPADGWLTKLEAETLWRWLNATTGPVLEVGCYKGRSTVLLATSGRFVLCVDPFNDFSTDDPSGNAICSSFAENMSLRNITNFSLARCRVEDWSPQPMGFVYLDGDHTYQGTVNQIRKAQLCEPQVIAIHDVNDSGDGKEIKRAALELLGPWNERTERLACWRL